MKISIFGFLLGLVVTIGASAFADEQISGTQAQQEISSILSPLLSKQGQMDTTFAVWTQGQIGQPCFLSIDNQPVLALKSAADPSRLNPAPSPIEHSGLSPT